MDVYYLHKIITFINLAKSSLLNMILLVNPLFLPQYKIKWILELTRFNYYSHAYLNKYIESSKTELVLYTVKSNSF